MCDSTMKPGLAAALAQLWLRFEPQMLERVVVLEAAAVAAGQGALGGAQLREAHEAAHKLAGALGSFNLTRGTVLARDLEQLYSAGDPPGVEDAAQLTALAAGIRALIVSHRSAAL